MRGKRCRLETRLAWSRPWRVAVGRRSLCSLIPPYLSDHRKVVGSGATGGGFGPPVSSFCAPSGIGTDGPKSARGGPVAPRVDINHIVLVGVLRKM